MADDSAVNQLIEDAVAGVSLNPESLERLKLALESETNQERLIEALHKALPSMVEQLYTDNANAMEEVLRESRTERVDFERLLIERWGEALDYFDFIYLLALEAGKQLAEQYGSTVESANDLVFETLKVLHGRALVVTSEISALLRTGHPSGSNARSRTLHELATVSFLVREHGHELAERYLLHQHIEAARAAEAYQEFCASRPPTEKHFPFSDEQIAKMRARREQLLQRFGPEYKKDWGWAASLTPLGNAPTVRALEEMAGLGHWRVYYGYGSSAIHAGAHAAARGLISHDDTEVLLAGPIDYGFAEIAHGALLSLSHVTTALLLYGAVELTYLDFLAATQMIHRYVEDAGQAFVKAESPRGSRPTATEK